MPTILDNLNDEQIMELYLNSLSANEKKSYLIAKSHLGLTFNLYKTISFIQWKKSMEEIQEEKDTK